MDKTKIPTKKITIGKGEQAKELEIREYLTQEQEDKRMNIMMGNKEVAITAGQEVTFMTKFSAISDARNYLVENLCVDLSVDEFNVLRPNLRKELVVILEALVEDVKKVESPKKSS